MAYKIVDVDPYSLSYAISYGLPKRNFGMYTNYTISGVHVCDKSSKQGIYSTHTFFKMTFFKMM